jgi:hypothetical protein
VEPKAIVFECGANCSCNNNCVNRTSQKGLQYRLEVGFFLLHLVIVTFHSLLLRTRVGYSVELKFMCKVVNCKLLPLFQNIQSFRVGHDY